MADALWNDIIYTDVLQNDGFVIDYAVCTTYSLDMPSLLSVPFMLGTMTDPDRNSHALSSPDTGDHQ